MEVEREACFREESSGVKLFGIPIYTSREIPYGEFALASIKPTQTGLRSVVQTQENIMKLSGSPRTEFVIKWTSPATPQYVRNWPTQLDPQYTPEIGGAMKFPTREAAGRFLLQSTYDAGQSNSMWNSGLIIVPVQESRNWEEVECGE